MKHKLVIFDWDGTVMDSAHKIIVSMKMAARKLSLPEPSSDAVKHIIGISLKPAIVELFNLDDQKLADEMVTAYKDAYAANESVPTPLFDGMIDVLNHLQETERLLAVATGKARRGLVNAWTQSNTQHYFSASRCADEAHSKPHPDMLIQLLSELNLNANEAVMIGDTSYDMAMAEALGMDRIGVSYGVHDNDAIEKHSPLAIIDSPTELISLL